MTTQLEGNILFGISDATTTDVSDEVFVLKLEETRAENTRRPSFANARRSARAGAITETCEIEFEENLDPSVSSAHKEIRAAIRRDDAKMYVSGTLKPGAVGPDNLRYYGYVVVTGVSTGGEVGEELEQSWTYTFDENGFSEDDGT